MKRSALALSAAIFAISSVGAPGLAAAQSAAEDAAVFRATTINLSAYGETRISPDMATITFGVTTQAPTAAEAMTANRTRMNTVAQALRAQGLADRDIQTSGLNLSPQYSYEQNQPPKLIGYQASNEVSITARDLTKLGGTVDAVVRAGVNQINGIAFGLQNPKTAEDQARRAAVQALAAKADLYAQATGLKVVRLVNLSEQSQGMPISPRPMMMRMSADAAEGRPTNIEPGELRVRIDLSGLYELGR